MCGFSVALGPNNELGVGAPGNFYFHGELYSVAPQSDYRNYIYTGGCIRSTNWTLHMISKMINTLSI